MRMTWPRLRAILTWAPPIAVALVVVVPAASLGEEAGTPALLEPTAGVPVGTSSEPSLPGRTDAAEGGGAIELDIYGGVRDLYKIAVPQPRGEKAVAADVQSIASRDLEISSLFKVLDPRSFLADTSAEGFDADAWRTVGAQGVVQGEATATGNKVRLSLKLYETARGTTPVLSKTYNGNAEEVRDMVHGFVNDLIAYFTGERGIFGSRIAFSRIIGRGHKEIFTVEMDGSDLQGVTKNGSINTMPAWIPGGGLFYTSFIKGAAQLFRTGRARPVLAEEGLNMGAAVAPGGGRMAVVLSRDGSADIYLANLDGSGLRNLTNHPSIDVSPTWSPDGSQIAFVSNRHGTPQIFVMGSGGGAPRRITFAGSYNQTPSWCPRADTPLIAFTGADGGTFDIFTVQSSGGQITRLTQAQGRNTDPTWSPDGRLIAFWSSRGGIHLMTPEGLNQQLILRGSAETLRWSSIGIAR
jgi:TolB protein